MSPTAQHSHQETMSKRQKKRIPNNDLLDIMHKDKNDKHQWNSEIHSETVRKTPQREFDMKKIY